MPICKWIAGGYDIDEIGEAEIWVQAQLSQTHRPVAGRVPVSWSYLVPAECITEWMKVSVAASRKHI